MGLASGPEVSLHPKVKTQARASKPATASPREFAWLGDFLQAQHRLIETAGQAFTVRGHGQLNMVDPGKRHVWRGYFVLFASIAGALGPTHMFMSTALLTL